MVKSHEEAQALVFSRIFPFSVVFGLYYVSRPIGGSFFVYRDSV